VKVFNVLGEEVRTLVHQIQNAGKHRIVWDGQDNLGRSVSTGLYFYQLKSNDIVRNRKMVVLK
jgi:flagellar hook assembly protein FlgD